MDFVRFSINNPVKVAVGVLLLMLFGILALVAIPVQLTPNVDQPMVTIETEWTGRSPEEVEKEIVEEQEDKLRSIQGLRKMVATASQGRSNIELEFFVGTDMTRALQEVSDKLREVPEYPEDVDEPVINVGAPAVENAIAWMILESEDPSFDVPTLYDTIDKRVKPYLERVTGLSEINVYGGRERQVHIQIDPRRLAERGITFNQLAQSLQRENVNVSAGDVASGRLDIRVRTIGQYDTLEEVRRTIVAYKEGGPVRVGDLGEVVLTLEKTRSFVRSRGQSGMAINAIRESGANVMQVMEGLRQRVKEVNETVLPAISAELPGNPKLRLVQVYDETGYIDDAINLVVENIWQGGALAVIVLLLFLAGRQSPRLVLLGVPTLIVLMLVTALLPEGTPRAVALGGLVLMMLVALVFSPPTAIIGLSIPISIVGTFVVMTLTGRNLNVVSLAGLAFATGNVVNAAIVVLENIDRHLGMGKTPRKAAYDGTREVWPSVFNTTLTTLAVFVPVIFVQEEAGQLFRDISLAICASVALSMIVAITVIPAASARWLKPHGPVHAPGSDGVGFRKGIVHGVGNVASRLGEAVADFVYLLCGSTLARVAVVVAFTAASLLGAWMLMPPTTYLPSGNKNLVFGIMLTPPAYNIDQARYIGERIENNFRPYWEAKSYEETAKLPPAIDFMTGEARLVPPMENYFFVSWNGTIFMGASSADEQNVAPLADMLTMNMSGIPGSMGFAFQDSLFGTGLGGTNTIDVELSADSLEQLRSASGALFMQLMGAYGPMNVRPTPLNFNLAGPELQVKIDRVRAADLGIDNASLGLGVEALVDGAIIGDYREGGDAIDLLLVRDPDVPLATDTLAQVPLAYDLGTGADESRGVVPLSSIATLEYAQAPQEIRRIEQRRAITLSVTPPEGMPLEAATTQIGEMVQGLRQGGALPPTVDVALAGTADKLTQVRHAFLGEWTGFNLQSLLSLLQSRMFIALLITFLVMAALFESWLYPLVIMFTVPLALVGGFMGLAVVHWFDNAQLLDVLTMLGFVILIGIVVDNATLLVYQALNYMRGFGESEEDVVEKLPPREAIRESVRTRLRPIMMNSLTNVFGMLPLVIVPGSGSELYRGLGSVVLGGLLVSTVFTLLVVPLLFSLVLDAKIAAYRALGWSVKELGVSDRDPIGVRKGSGGAMPVPASPDA